MSPRCQVLARRRVDSGLDPRPRRKVGYDLSRDRGRNPEAIVQHRGHVHRGIDGNVGKSLEILASEKVTVLVSGWREDSPISGSRDAVRRAIQPMIDSREVDRDSDDPGRAGSARIAEPEVGRIDEDRQRENLLQDRELIDDDGRGLARAAEHRQARASRKLSR